MFLLSGITLFLDAGRKGNEGRHGDSHAGTEFPSGLLTSSAWEGWWHEDPAGSANGHTAKGRTAKGHDPSA